MTTASVKVARHTNYVFTAKRLSFDGDEVGEPTTIVGLPHAVTLMLNDAASGDTMYVDGRPMDVLAAMEALKFLGVLEGK